LHVVAGAFSADRRDAERNPNLRSIQEDWVWGGIRQEYLYFTHILLIIYWRKYTGWRKRWWKFNEYFVLRRLKRNNARKSRRTVPRANKRARLIGLSFKYCI
jgi:hypothetical protein